MNYPEDAAAWKRTIEAACNGVSILCVGDWSQDPLPDNEEGMRFSNRFLISQRSGVIEVRGPLNHPTSVVAFLESRDGQTRGQEMNLLNLEAGLPGILQALFQQDNLAKF